MLDLRIRQRATLSQEEQQLLEKHENHLDMLVSLFRAYGIYLITEDAQQASSELLQAIDKGKARLKRITDIKAGIETAAKLVDLGAAILSRDPGALLEAAASLRSKPKKDDAPA